MNQLPESSCGGWNMQFSERVILPDLKQCSFNIMELHTQNVGSYFRTLQLYVISIKSAKVPVYFLLLGELWPCNQ